MRASPFLLLASMLIAPPLAAQPALSPDSLNARWARAIDGDDENAIAALLDAGASVRGTGAGMAPLYRAARQGRTAIGRTLLAHGAELNAADALRGTTPLHAAAFYGHADFVALLIEAGADLETVSPIGFAAFDWALESEQRAIMVLLLDAIRERSPANEHASLDLMQAVIADDSNRLESLLSAGADADVYNRTGYAALALAARLNQGTLVDLLLDAGANPNAGDVARDEATPLMQAARGGHVEIGRRLLRAGADVHRRNARGFTALFMTALYDRAEFALLLLDAGVDPTIRSSDANPPMDDYTALDYAFEQSPAMIPVFVEWWARDDAASESERTLAGAVECGDLDAAAEALASLDTGRLDSDFGSLLLAIAASHDGGEGLRLLLANGADPDRMNPAGYPALAVAARLGRTENARLLLEAGANPDRMTRSRYDTTPLMEAVRENHLEVARLLLDAGADVDRRDRYGDTALNWATMLGQPDIAALLLEREASPRFVGRTGETPLETAKRLQFPRIAGLLEGALAEVH